ncbi:fimbrial protein [Klebsiella sp. I138]|uniref:fimbrial protein n=1 Tax=Klebsiella sp. I138 TaxID=2755385 RepID=UPI003DAA128C
MKMKNTLASVAVAAALMSSSALAADGTINFRGKLVANTCDITINDQASPGVVVLPTLAASTLATAGQTAGKTQFNIGLTNCEGMTSTSTAAAFFENGATVNTTTFNLINTDTSATGAENVQLQLLDATSDQAINIGNQNQRTNTSRIDASTASVVLPYAVQYYSLGTATAGDVTSQVNFSIDYE